MLRGLIRTLKQISSVIIDKQRYFIFEELKSVYQEINQFFDMWCWPLTKNIKFNCQEL